ncbi:unnamed protein product, partial [Discosporangium mesarthrocarpum]
MSCCWHEDPHARPGFASILATLTQYGGRAREEPTAGVWGLLGAGEEVEVEVKGLGEVPGAPLPSPTLGLTPQLRPDGGAMGTVAAGGLRQSRGGHQEHPSGCPRKSEHEQGQGQAGLPLTPLPPRCPGAGVQDESGHEREVAAGNGNAGGHGRRKGPGGGKGGRSRRRGSGGGGAGVGVSA